MEVGVGAVALSGGVISVHSPVKVLVLGDPDVGGEDLDGQRAVGHLLRIGIQLCCAGIARGRHGDSQLTFAVDVLRWLKTLAAAAAADGRGVLGCRVLPPLQTGQHDCADAGTFLQTPVCRGRP